MSAPNPKTCPVCGGPMDSANVSGCPQCLMRAAMQPTAQPGGEAHHPAPSIASVVAAFPQLEILELIGQGGMGCVFKARQPKLNRLVALKLLPASLTERDAAFAGRFEREGQLLARLHHPNIVAVHDSGKAGEYFYLIMEYVDGVNLRQAMRARRFTPGQALAIIPHICDALQFAHDEGVLHRDIKPENILLDAKGRVKLADFGIAKLLGSDADTPVRDSIAQAKAPGLTQSGTALGTPSYMSPEQRESPSDVDHRADIYSLGVVFYELLTGELPQGALARPSEKSDADPRVDAIVQQALETERDRRQHSAGEVKTQVETIAGVPPALQGAVSEGIAVPAIFSRAAICGGCWAALLFVAFPVFVLPLRRMPPGEHQGFPWWLKMVIPAVGILGLAAPFGTTILGWIAVSQIRRSAGKIYGLGLAVFDGLLFPLFALTGLIGWFWHWVFVDLIRTPIIIAGRHGLSAFERMLVMNATAFTVLATVLTSLVVGFLIIRRVWRSVSKPSALTRA